MYPLKKIYISCFLKNNSKIVVGYWDSIIQLNYYYCLKILNCILGRWILKLKGTGLIYFTI